MTPNIHQNDLYALQNGTTGNFLRWYTDSQGDTQFRITDPEKSGHLQSYLFVVHVVHRSPLAITLKTGNGKENISTVHLDAVPKRDDNPNVQWNVRHGCFRDEFYFLESVLTTDDGRTWLGAAGNGELQGNIGNYRDRKSSLGDHLYWRFVHITKEPWNTWGKLDIYKALKSAQDEFNEDSGSGSESE